MHGNHEEYFECKECGTRIFISKANGELEPADKEWVERNPCCKKAYANFMEPGPWKDFGR